MNINRVFGSGSLILAGALVALSVNGWVGAAQATPEPVRESATITRPALQEEPASDAGPGVSESDYYYYLGDAWASFEGSKVAEQIGADHADKAFSVSYVGTYSTEPHWPGCVAVASKTYLGTFHVFYVNTGT